MISSETMNYNETRDKYTRYRRNLISAEKDEMGGNLIQTTSHMTPKTEKILFVREYLKTFGKITATGLAREKEGIFRNTKRKPNEQLVKDFAEILKDLVNLGILKTSGSYRGNISYTKTIEHILKLKKSIKP